MGVGSKVGRDVFFWTKRCFDGLTVFKRLAEKLVVGKSVENFGKPRGSRSGNAG